jgi:hypothetical protein
VPAPLGTSVDQQITDSFAQALQQATAAGGSATVGFRNGSSDESTETGYDITVTRVVEVRAA